MVAISNSGTVTTSLTGTKFYGPQPAATSGSPILDPIEVPTQFKNRVLIDPDETNIAHIIGWCFENLENQFQYDHINFYIKPDGKYMRIFSFAKKEDAVAFKLTWS